MQPQPWGRYFDDFTVGEVIKHWPGRTIRDFDDTWFTLMTMNTNPIHFDDHFASQSQHGKCLVNGTLVFLHRRRHVGARHQPDRRRQSRIRVRATSRPHLPR
jgi:acyl dehydratase